MAVFTRKSNELSSVAQPTRGKWKSLAPRSHPEANVYSVNTAPNQHDTSSVAVILGYFNGEKFFLEQISSILAQTHQNISVFISDDCSDRPLSLAELADLSGQPQRIFTARTTTNVGFCKNFLGALAAVNDSYHYFAFSDQDDIWHAEKIANAIKILSQSPLDKPALYCGRTEIFDESCETNLGNSSLFKRPASFPNALIQNIGGANTMVFNKAARDLIAQSTQAQDIDVASHDWWCYQIVSGAGGIVHYDPNPCLKYRQHDGNLVGSNNGWVAKLVRIKWLLEGKLRDWNNKNIAALSKNRNLLTTENQKILDDFIIARQSGVFKRLFLFWRTGIYRQTTLQNMILFLGLLMNKI